jgi:hypothetical protein
VAVTFLLDSTPRAPSSGEGNHTVGPVQPSALHSEEEKKRLEEEKKQREAEQKALAEKQKAAVSPRASRLDSGLLYSPAKRDPIVRLTSWINENDFTCLREACGKDFCTITLHAYMAEFSLDLRKKQIQNQVQPWELLSTVSNREIGRLKNGAAGMSVEIKPGPVIRDIRYHWISITGEVEANRIQWQQ